MLPPACVVRRSRGSLQPVRAGVAAAVIVLSLVVAVLGGTGAVRNRPPGTAALVAAALAEVAVLAQSGVALVVLARGEHPPEVVTSVAYLLGILVVLPLATAWALIERTRWSGVVILVGALTVAVMTARLQMLWRGAGA
jgi:hypothetical protein